MKNYIKMSYWIFKGQIFLLHYLTVYNKEISFICNGVLYLIYANYYISLFLYNY